MAEKFNIMDLVAKKKQASANAEIVLIPISQLIPHKKNRQIKDIDKLAEAILTAGGIKQPLFVRKEETGYKLLAGHRRTAATELLLSQGKITDDRVPCIVETELDEDEQEILLIVLNEQQEKTGYEKMQDAIRLKELITKKKYSENIPGTVRELTAEALGETKTQIARYENIDKKLIPELKAELKEEKIGISAAYEASRLEPEKQKAVLQQPDRSIKAIKNLSESDKPKPKPKISRKTQIKEELEGYICDELCKHTNKKESNLMKECNRCKVARYLEAL